MTGDSEGESAMIKDLACGLVREAGLGSSEAFPSTELQARQATLWQALVNQGLLTLTDNLFPEADAEDVDRSAWQHLVVLMEGLGSGAAGSKIAFGPIVAAYLDSLPEQSTARTAHAPVNALLGVPGGLLSSLWRAEPLIQASSISSGEWRLEGRLSVLIEGSSAASLLIPAQTTDGDSDIPIFLLYDNIDAHHTRYELADGTPVSDIVFADMVSRPMTTLATGSAATRLEVELSDAIALALCAEAVGVFETMIKQAVDFARVRSQFGRPIAEFQAVQHRLSDAVIAAEHSRALVRQTAAHVDFRGLRTNGIRVAVTRSFVTQACLEVARNVVQVHGAIGVTDDLPLARYTKRLLTISSLAGNTLQQQTRIADSIRKGQLNELLYT